MKGHIRERGKGNWYAVIAVGKKRKWIPLKAAGRREAQSECARLVTELTGQSIEPHRMTVGQFLTRWLAHKKPTIAPLTFERYEVLATKNSRTAGRLDDSDQATGAANFRSLRQGIGRGTAGREGRAVTGPSTTCIAS